MLSDLIEVSQDGADFYTEAAQSVSDKELSKLFKQMATVKTRFVQDLSAEMAPPPKPTKTAGRAKPAETKAEAWLGDLQGTYKGLRTGSNKIGPDQVGQLDLAEAQLMERVQQVRHDKSNSYVIRVHAMQYEGKARPVHELLRARRRRLQGA
jgi:uncharacterized protein (TIGR02284 family)